tara:strand:- start:195 stop:464 length:270 start_codon:yes stop_codon:yes gene_type:complete
MIARKKQSFKNNFCVILSLPNNIKNKIELDAIILLKMSIGWKEVHDQIKTYCQIERYLSESIQTRIQDIFSMDEDGNYLDDICGKISYW